MIQHFDLGAVTLNDIDLTLRPCNAADKATLTRWFGEDGIDRWQVRVVDEFTIWPFMIARNGADAGFLQVWRTHAGVGGLEIFVTPEQRRRGIAVRSLTRIAQHLRDKLGWQKITIEPHSDDAPAIRCFEKAGFRDFGERRDDGDHTHIILKWP
jgi:RimJ/RimL family protein N-acetyltransferase